MGAQMVHGRGWVTSEGHKGSQSECITLILHIQDRLYVILSFYSLSALRTQKRPSSNTVSVRKCFKILSENESLMKII